MVGVYGSCIVYGRGLECNRRIECGRHIEYGRRIDCGRCTEYRSVHIYLFVNFDILMCYCRSSS